MPGPTMAILELFWAFLMTSSKIELKDSKLIFMWQSKIYLILTISKNQSISVKIHRNTISD